MTLHEDTLLFNDLVEASAKSLGMAPIFVEKDYWVMLMLKRLSKSKYKDIAIFKGGTSLSKAYKIIERFSEDIDIAIIDETQNGNQLKRTIKSIEKELTSELFTEVKMPQTSKGSKFRKTVHQYPQNFKGNFGHASENILLELNAFANPYPIAKKSLSTYIYDFVADKDENIVKKYDLEPFYVNVLDITRTFCEKLSAIARASYEDDENHTKLKEKIRHFYDIYFLMKEKNIQNFIKSDDSTDMLKAVKKQDLMQFGSKDNWTNVPFHKIDIFLQKGAVLDELASFYSGEFSALVYDKHSLPSINEIKSKIEMISTILQIKMM